MISAEQFRNRIAWYCGAYHRRFANVVYVQRYPYTDHRSFAATVRAQRLAQLRHKVRIW